MEQQTQLDSKVDFSGGLITFQNLFAVPPNATPNCLDVKFGIGAGIEKRLGSTTLNATILVSSAATGFAPDSNGTLSTVLQAYWKLDETTGTRLDSIGTNNLTDVNSNVLSAGGKLANAGSFIAANSAFLQRLNDPVLDTGNVNFSVSCWIWPTSPMNSTSRFFLAKGAAGDSNLEWRLSVESAGSAVQFTVTSDTGSTSTSVTTGGTVFNAWNMITAYYDSTNALIGVRMGTATASSAAYTVGIRVSSGPFYVGTESTGSGIRMFDGMIDELGFWKKVLTNQEVTDLFNGNAANTYNKGASNSGFGSFDFGAGFAGGVPLRHLVVAAGTGIFASSNRGVSFVTIATDRGADYQEFERSNAYLIAVSNTNNRVLYWAGSVGTFMAGLPVGSAPAVKHALDFNGFLLLMNDSGGQRRITYADNTKLLTDPFNSSFTITSSFDDEITGGVIYYQAAYVFTRYTVNRLTPVGGNPDFSVRQVKTWGAVPRTIKKVTLQGIGEVIMCLGYDRHVRIFDGIEDRIISTPIEQNNGLSPVYLNGIPPQQLQKCFAEVDTEEQVYRLWLVMTPSTETTHALCFDLRTNAWYPYSQNAGFNTAIMSESGNSRILTGVTRAGFVHWINTTNTDMGTAIDEYFDTPLLFSTPRTVTKAQKLSFYFRPTSSGTILFQDRSDFSSTWNAPRDRLAFTDTTSRIHLQKVVDVPVTQNVVQFRITDSASAANPWFLSRIDKEGRDLGIGKA